MSAFTIMVDSSCDLPPEFLEAGMVEITPMPYELDGTPHNSGYWQEISGEDFYDALHRGCVAKTSQINPDSFEVVFTDYAKQGRGLLCIVLSSGLSATYQNAVIALMEVKASYPECDIHVVDSISASCGHGLLAMLACEKCAEGLSAGETASWLEKKKHSCMAFFTVDDLMYLHRGGRLSKLSAIAGTVISIKPMLNIAPDGTLCQKDKVRGKKAALALMVDQLKRCVAPGATLGTVLISHTDCLDTAQILADMIREEFKVKDVIIMLMGPIIGAHLGPGAVTLVFEGSITRNEYEGI